MNYTSTITIQAPLNSIFLAAADVARWPEFLSHYRYNRFLEHRPSGGVIKTSCTVAGLNTNWVSNFYIDTKAHQLQFQHTQSTLAVLVGMNVVWDFVADSEGGVNVTITHTIGKGLPLLGNAAELLIKSFIQDNAKRSLEGLKRKVEMQILVNN